MILVPLTSNKIFVAGAALAALVVVAMLDYVTGYEVSVFVLYAFPVALAAWYLNLAWGLSFAVVSTAVWQIVDYWSGHHYSRPWIAIDRTINGLLMLSFIAFSFDAFRRAQRQGRNRIKQLEGALPICSSCNRIRDEEGNWTDLGSYLAEHTDAEPRAKLCPDCSRAQYVAGYPEGKPSG